MSDDWTTLMDEVHRLIEDTGMECPEHHDDEPLCMSIAAGLWLEGWKQAQPIAPAPDTATVLAGLVEEMTCRAQDYDRYDQARYAFKECLRMVEAAQQRQATSGARAAGGDDGPIRLNFGDEATAQAYQHFVDDNDRLRRERNEWMEEANTPRASAPPTPSAPGVAALLAECARRQETYGDKWISIWQIRRLLAPEGADES